MENMFPGKKGKMDTSSTTLPATEKPGETKLEGDGKKEGKDGDNKPVEGAKEAPPAPPANGTPSQGSGNRVLTDEEAEAQWRASEHELHKAIDADLAGKRVAEQSIGGLRDETYEEIKEFDDSTKKAVFDKIQTKFG